MKLLNSLSNELTEVKSTSKLGVTVYSCGPTVYDTAHIGNLRTFILDDLLRRSLRADEHEVLAVMNITDIDDKTIAQSQSEFPELEPLEALLESTRAYETRFMDDLEAVGIDTDTMTFVRATESIGEMQALISDIYKNGFAYISEGSVYFDLAKYRAAGNTYGRLINVDYSAQARIDNDEYEKNEAQDFALWKGSKAGEPFWDFNLDLKSLPGRPGWHIECSAMAVANLSQPITIHTGGIDLKFPHHENEIAQTQAGTGKDLSDIFVHHNHLYVDSRKMSKSLGNFYTLADIIVKGFSPLAFRLLVLQAHHESELNFTWASLEAAQNSLLGLYAWADRIFQDEPSISIEVADTLMAALNDNLNSPVALAQLFELTAHVPSIELLDHLDAIFGLELSGRVDITDEAKALISQRNDARAAKDFDASDKLRDELAEHHIEIEDTPNGPRWHRTIL